MFQAFLAVSGIPVKARYDIFHNTTLYNCIYNVKALKPGAWKRIAQAIAIPRAAAAYSVFNAGGYDSGLYGVNCKSRGAYETYYQ